MQSTARFDAHALCQGEELPGTLEAGCDRPSRGASRPRPRRQLKVAVALIVALVLLFGAAAQPTSATVSNVQATMVCGRGQITIPRLYVNGYIHNMRDHRYFAVAVLYRYNSFTRTWGRYQTGAIVGGVPMGDHINYFNSYADRWYWWSNHAPIGLLGFPWLPPGYYAVWVAAGDTSPPSQWDLASYALSGSSTYCWVS